MFRSSFAIVVAVTISLVGQLVNTADAALVLEYAPGVPVLDTDGVPGGIADIDYASLAVEPEINPPAAPGGMIISTLVAIVPGGIFDFSLTVADPEVDFLGAIFPDPTGTGAAMFGFAGGPGLITCPVGGCIAPAAGIPAGTPLVLFDLVESAGVGGTPHDDAPDIVLSSVLGGVFDPIAGGVVFAPPSVTTHRHRLGSLNHLPLPFSG